MPASPSIQRLKSRKYSKRLKPLTPQIEALIAALKAIPVSTKLPADVLSQLRATVRFGLLKARHMERLDARRMARVKVISWHTANGVKLAQTYDINRTLAWLLDRKQRGSNVHAMAQGKRTFLKLGVEHYQRIGRKGAQVRWERERAKKAAQTLENPPQSANQ